MSCLIKADQLFRCWKTKTAYDESTYLEALKRKGSPLLKYAWKVSFKACCPPQGVLLAIHYDLVATTSRKYIAQ